MTVRSRITPPPHRSFGRRDSTARPSAAGLAWTLALVVALGLSFCDATLAGEEPSSRSPVSATDTREGPSPESPSREAESPEKAARASTWLDRLGSTERALDLIPPAREGRAWLAKRGLTLSLSLASEAFVAFRGSARRDRPTGARSLLDLLVKLDTERAGLWAGGTITLHAQAADGDGITPKLDVAQCLTNIEGRRMEQSPASASTSPSSTAR